MAVALEEPFLNEGAHKHSDQISPSRVLLPSLQEVARQMQQLTMQPQSSVFNKKGFVLSAGYEYHHFLRRDMMAIRAIILNELHGDNWHRQLFKLMKGYFNKDQLIKTLEVMQHLSALSYSTPGVFSFMRSELSSVRDERGYKIPLVDVSAAALHADITTWVYQLITIKLFMGVPARHAEALAQTFCKNIDSAWSRADVLAAVVRMPMPATLWNCNEDELQSFCDSLGNVATDESLDGTLIDESWFGQGSPLCDAGWKYAWSSGLNVVHFNNITPEQRTAELKDLTGIEFIILASIRVLLSGMIGELKSQVDTVTTLQTKTLGAVVSVLMIGVSYLWHQYGVAPGWN